MPLVPSPSIFVVSPELIRLGARRPRWVMNSVIDGSCAMSFTSGRDPLSLVVAWTDPKTGLPVSVRASLHHSYLLGEVDLENIAEIYIYKTHHPRAARYSLLSDDTLYVRSADDAPLAFSMSVPLPTPVLAWAIERAMQCTSATIKLIKSRESKKEKKKEDDDLPIYLPLVRSTGQRGSVPTEEKKRYM